MANIFSNCFSWRIFFSLSSDFSLLRVWTFFRAILFFSSWYKFLARIRVKVCTISASTPQTRDCYVDSFGMLSADLATTLSHTHSRSTKMHYASNFNRNSKETDRSEKKILIFHREHCVIKENFEFSFKATSWKPSLVMKWLNYSCGVTTRASICVHFGPWDSFIYLFWFSRMRSRQCRHLISANAHSTVAGLSRSH